MSFSLTYPQQVVLDILKRQNYKCSLSGLPIEYPETAVVIENESGDIEWIHKDLYNLKSNYTKKDLVFFSEKILFYNLFKNRPNWNKYYLTLARLISVRSPDPSTKHGCVIVNKEHRVISVGYNGPIQGIDDKKVPTSRPEKYPYFLHAEENAMAFASQSIEDATVYITGMPCSRCLRELLQRRIKKIICGNAKSNCISDSDMQASYQMLDLTDTQLEIINDDDHP